MKRGAESQTIFQQRSAIPLCLGIELSRAPDNRTTHNGGWNKERSAAARSTNQATPTSKRNDSHHNELPYSLLKCFTLYILYFVCMRSACMYNIYQAHATTISG